MTDFIVSDQDVRIEIETNLDDTLAVSAGAGTGKTTLLTKRYISLLQKKKIKPSEIVAITFTKKAAGELRERILQAMVSHQMTESILQFEVAPIGTIHSFCANILKRFALEAGIDPHFEQMETVDWFDFLRESFRTWFGDHVEKTSAYQDFRATGHGFYKVQDLAFSLYQYRDLIHTIKIDFQPLSLDRIGSFVEHIESIFQFGQTCCKDMTDEGYLVVHHLRESLKNILQLPPPEAAKILLREDKISVKGRQTSWNTKDQGKQFKELVGQLQEELEVLQSDLSKQLLSNLVDWLKDFLRYVEDEKRRRSMFDFDDLLLMTRNLLRNHKTVLHALQQQYSYYLIDEFQDTDPIQAEIFWMLGRDESGSSEAFSYDDELTSGKIFTVGDACQSIYRFRNASIETFHRCVDSIQRKGKLLRIVQNFRSNPYLLETLNPFFQNLLSDQFQELSVLPTAGWSDPAIHVLKQIDGKPKANEIRTHEAFGIANHIRRLVDSGTDIYDRSLAKTRKLNFGDIAILCPVLTNLEVYETNLKSANIPFSLYQSNSFFQTLEIRSLTHVLGAILHPYDELKVVEGLSSMFIGFSFEDLVQVRKMAGSFDYRHMQTEKLTNPIKHSMEILQKLHQQSMKLSPSQLCKAMIRITHAFENSKFRFNPEQTEQNIKKLVWLAKDFENKESHNVFRFEAWLRDLSIHSKDSTEARVPTQLNAVQIMTIHQSKGLEFAVVFVANLGSRVTSSSTWIANHYHQTFEFRLGDRLSKLKTSNFDTAHESENEFLNEEKKRLMYVALTRAKNILVLPSPSENDASTYMEWIAPIFDQANAFEMFIYDRESKIDAKAPIRTMIEIPQSEIRVDFSNIPKGFQRTTATQEKTMEVEALPKSYAFQSRPTLGIAFHAYVQRHVIADTDINDLLFKQIIQESMLEKSGSFKNID